MNEIEQRRKKFEAMGIKLTEQTTVPPITASNKDVYNKIEQIRRGALKKDMQQLTNGKSPQSGFQAIPVPKKRTNPNQKSSEFAVEPQSFAAQKSSEFSEIERMFDGGGGSTITSKFDTYAQNPLETSMNIDSIGPGFSPDAIRSQMQQRIKEKYGVTPQPEMNRLDSIPSNYKNQIKSETEPTLNYFHIKDMIKEMVQDELEKSIGKILDEYLGKNKKQPANVFEIVDAKKGLIKIKDKVYKLSKA